MLRRLVLALIPVVLMVAFLATAVDATANTEPAPPADGVGFLGEVTSITPTALVVNDGRQAHTITITPGTRVDGLDKLTVGTPVFVGAHRVASRLEARVVQDLRSSRLAPDATAMEHALDRIREGMTAVPASASSESSVSAEGQCVTFSGFQPASDMVNFAGCFSLAVGGHFTYSTPVNPPVRVFAHPSGLAIDVTAFSITTGLGAFRYELPFRFTAVDAAAVALETWVDGCVKNLGTVIGCPNRPATPAPGSPRAVQVNVTPVDPSPAPSYSEANGALIVLGLLFHTPIGCGPIGLSPCQFPVDIPAAPVSFVSQARGKAPLVDPQVLRAEAVACPAIGMSWLLPPVVGTFISPFDILVCTPLTIVPSFDDGFRAKVSSPDGTVLNQANVLKFTGDPLWISATPTNTGDNSYRIRFTDFDYRPSFYRGLQLKFKTAGGFVFGQFPEWIVSGNPNESVPLISTPFPSIAGLAGNQKTSIDIAVSLPPVGVATVSEMSPTALDPAGSVTVRVLGRGFKPIVRNGAPVAGTGVNLVVLEEHDALGNVVNTFHPPFTTPTNDELLFTPPPHAPTLDFDAQGQLVIRDLRVRVFAWGAEVPGNYTVAYAHPPVITRMDAAPDPNGEAASGSPVVSTAGGTRITIEATQLDLSLVAGVLVDGEPVPFERCGTDAAPDCYPSFRAAQPRLQIIAPPHDTGTANVALVVACANDYINAGILSAFCGIGENQPLYYKAPPSLGSLSPPNSAPAGGGTLTLSGTGFAGVGTNVRFGQTSLGSICNYPGCSAAPNNTALTVTVPSGTPGTSVPVSVQIPCPNESANGFQGAACGTSNALWFTYVGLPTISTVSPATGPHSGGTTVTIRGTGFSTASGAIIQGQSFPVTIVSDSELTMVMPSGYPALVGSLPATVNIVVATVCGTSGPGATSCGVSNTEAFTYEAPPSRATTALFVPEPTGTAGNPMIVSATLTSGAGVAGKTVDFAIQGSPVGSAVTDASGVATLTAGVPPLASGLYASGLTATFTGDATHAGSTASAQLTIVTSQVVVRGPGPSAPSLTGVIEVASGRDFALARRADGTVAGWGAGAGGSVPAGLSNVVGLEASGSTAAAVKADGSIVFWATSNAFLPPSSLPPAKAVSMVLGRGGFGLALTTSGGVAGWAADSINTQSPIIDANASSGVIAIAAGIPQSLALKSDGTVVAWGNCWGWNASCQNREAPPVGLTGVTDIATSFLGSIALKSDGTVVTWGNERWAVPAGVTNAIAVDAGAMPSALLADGTIVAWLDGVISSWPGRTLAYSQGGSGNFILDEFFTTIVVPEIATTTTVAAVNAVRGGPATLTATVVTGDTPLEGGTVTFALNGIGVGAALTNVAGVAVLNTVVPTSVVGGTWPQGVSAVLAPIGGFAGSSATAALTLPQPQTITFEPLADRSFGDAPFHAVGSASSGLPVTIAASGACTVDASGLVTLTGGGACTLTASQAGGPGFEPAPDVTRSFLVRAVKLQTTTVVTCTQLTYTGAPLDPCDVVVSAPGLHLTPEPAYPSGSTTAGQHSASYTYPGNENYEPSFGMASFVIAPAPAVVSLTCPASVTYTGTPQTPCTAVATGAGGLNVAITPTYISNVNAGIASVYAIFPDSGSHQSAFGLASFTIAQAPVVGTLSCPGSVPYTGASQMPCTAQVSGPGFTTVWTPYYANNTNAGTATATLNFGGSANIASLLIEKTFTITKASSTTTVSCPASVPYGGAAQTPCSVTVTGLGLNLTPAAVYQNNVNAGTAAASYAFDGGVNHTASSDSDTFEIVPVASATTVTCPASVIYSGAPRQPCTVTVTGPGLNLTPVAVYANNLNVGTATASYTFAGDGNHGGSSDSKTFAIGKAASTTMVTINGAPFSYTGAAVTPATVSVTGAGGSILAPAAVAVYANNVNAGTASANYSFAGDDNHEPSSDSETFAIGKAASTTTVTIHGGPFTFTGAAHTPASVSVTGLGLNVTPSAVYANNVNAGTATASYSFAGDANHDPSGDSETFAIGQAAATVDVQGYSGAYDGAAHGATGTAIGINGEDLSAFLNLGASFTDAPGGTARWTFSSGANYADQTGEAAITIGKAASTTTVTIAGGPFAYRGAAQTPATVAVTGVGLTLTPEATYVNNVNAGTATASYSFAGDANHEPSSDSANFAIGKAVATVVVQGYTGVYDGASHGSTGTATGVNGEDLSAALNLGGSFTNAPGGTAQWSFSGGGNYADQNGEAAISIAKAAAAIVVNGFTGVYDGAAHGATGSAIGVAGEDLSANLALGATFTNAPGGSANWTFTGSSNYADQSGDAAINIAKANATVIVNGFSGAYDGAAHGATGSATGVGGASLSANLTLGATFTNAPGGTAQWSFAGGSNYNDQNGSIAIVIAKAPLTVTANDIAKLYGAAVPALTATYAGFVNGDTMASLDAAVVLATSATASSSVGIYPITVTGGADVNYDIARVNGVLTIAPPTTPTTDVRLAIQRARAGIAAMLPSGDRATDRRLREALERIDQALAPWLWTDQSHLTVFGGLVFQQIKQAINLLPDGKKKQPFPVALDLVDALRDLAEEALEDAIDDGSPATVIRKATRDLELGDEALDSGRLDNAIERYRQAWAVAELLPRLKHHHRDRRRFDRGRTDRTDR
jgi:hypothetical protein